MTTNPSLLPEIGPDGLPREAPVIAYTEKKIEEEQIQLKKYIEENYSKIRDVEKELANLTMELKLTAGPKKAALEHMRKKIEMSTERIRLAKLNEEQARKVWEAALQAVKDEEAVKQKLCVDLNQLVQESSNTQFSRLEELKRRLEALNPSRASVSDPHVGNLVGLAKSGSTSVVSVVAHASEPTGEKVNKVPSEGVGGSVSNTQNQQLNVEGEGRGKKKTFQGRGRGIGAVPKGRGSQVPGWTGAGFDA
ncbi:RAB6-interacting golgin [Dillenia turbinata]|uniref:RAB6-interacting golgin n=1 Tax=Dillenia turbinata TaxID=194707 RepID=A0AAN8V7D3_9MAGN